MGKDNVVTNQTVGNIARVGKHYLHVRNQEDNIQEGEMLRRRSDRGNQEREAREISGTKRERSEDGPEDGAPFVMPGRGGIEPRAGDRSNLGTEAEGISRSERAIAFR